MIVRSLFWILLLSCIPAGRSVAQGAAPLSVDSSHALLVINSSPESAWVMLDTAVVGKTPCSLAFPAPATYHMRIQHPDVASWLTGTVDDTLTVNRGEIVRRMYMLETWTLVVSSPMGADVVAGDSLLGSTPLLLRTGQISDATPLTVCPRRGNGGLFQDESRQCQQRLPPDQRPRFLVGPKQI
jgi:hypothetical protein